MSSIKKSDPQIDAFEQFRTTLNLPATVSTYTAMKLAWLGALRWAGARSEKDPAPTPHPYSNH